jgi:hypothetical protein
MSKAYGSPRRSFPAPLSLLVVVVVIMRMMIVTMISCGTLLSEEAKQNLELDS